MANFWLAKGKRKNIRNWVLSMMGSSIEKIDLTEEELDESIDVAHSYIASGFDDPNARIDEDHWAFPFLQIGAFYYSAQKLREKGSTLVPDPTYRIRKWKREIDSYYDVEGQ